MRIPFLLALVVLLAGCASQSSSPNPSQTSHAALSGWTLDCAQGGYERVSNASWAQDCEARASHSPGPKEETWIAVNPKNPDNVVVGAKDLNPANSKECVWNGVFVTHDGGKTWKDVVIGGTYESRTPTSPFYGYACNTDPDFQFTADGALHYGVEMYGLGSQNAEGPLPKGTPGNGQLSQGYKILLATSNDGGDTWPQVITFQPDIVIVTDYSRMTVNPVDSAIIEAIGSDGGSRCHVLVSKDGGKTAEPMVDVQTPFGAPCNSGAGTAIAVSPKGTVVLMGGDATGDPAGVTGSGTQPIVVRSTDDGMTWLDSNAGFKLKPISSFSESKYRVGSVAELTYDLTKGPRAGTLYTCYPSADRDESDVYVRSSKDDGKTWSDPVLVNQDAAGTHQWMCNLGVASDGTLHVFFFDKSYDAANGHKLIDVTHAISTDGGKSFTTERVSTVDFDGDLGKHQEGFPFIGDYLGVSCVKDDCWAGFPDASNGVTTVVAAAHVHKSA